MFRLNFRSSAKLIPFGPLSSALYYFSDDRKLKNSIDIFEKKFRVKLTESNKKNFLKRDVKQIIISNLKLMKNFQLTIFEIIWQD